MKFWKKISVKEKKIAHQVTEKQKLNRKAKIKYLSWEPIYRGILQTEELALNVASLNCFAQELCWHNFKAIFH